MTEVFVDIGYHVALIDVRDRLHSAAIARGQALWSARATFVTTESVLIEFLTYLSGGGAYMRAAAFEYVVDLRESSEFVVLPHTSKLFDAASISTARGPTRATA